MTDRPQVIRRLQTLRFLAAALVLIGHVRMELQQHNFGSDVQALLVGIPWGVGVDIFFVISGFIISHTNLGARSKREVLVFWIRRFIRVWPIYAIFTALMIVAVFTFPNSINHAALTPQYVGASFGFVPWPRPDDGRMFPVLGQGWTLNYEMFFYLCFGASLLLAPGKRLIVLAVGGLVLVFAGEFLKLSPILEFYGNPIVLEFILGTLLGAVYRRWPEALTPGLVMIAASFALFGWTCWSGVYVDETTSGAVRFLTLGVTAALLVGGVLFTGRIGEGVLGRQPLIILGDASYALYLSHTFVVNLVLLLGMKIGLVQPWVFAVVMLVSSVIVSVATYKHVERPLLKLLSRLYRPNRDA